VSFEEMSIEPDSESFHSRIRLGFADGSAFVLEFFFLVEIKLISEGFIVPLHVLFLRFKSRCIFHCRAGLVEMADFSYCGSLQIEIPIDDSERIGEGLKRCELGRGRFSTIAYCRDQRLEPREGRSIQVRTYIQDFVPFIVEARGLSVQLNLTFGEEGKEVFSLVGEHKGIRDFGFLLVAILVRGNHLIVIVMPQGIMPCFERFNLIVEGF